MAGGGASEGDAESLYPTMVASTLSGMLVRVPLHPIDTCKAKLQVQRPSHSNAPQPFSSVLSCLRYTYAREGVRGLYAGFPIAFFGSAPAACLYLTSYEVSKRWLNAVGGDSVWQPAVHFTSGLLAETVSCVLWVPIDIVKERMQVQAVLPANSSLHYNSTMHAISTIARTEGLRGIYRGYGATLASFGPYSAFYLSIYEQLKDVQASLYKVAPAALPFHSFLLAGAIAGGAAAFITNPLDMAKLRLQVQRAQQQSHGGTAAAAAASGGGVSGVGSGLEFGYKNLVDGMRKVVAESGWKGLWKGVGARVLFFMPSSALNIAIFDTVKSYINEQNKHDKRVSSK